VSADAFIWNAVTSKNPTAVKDLIGEISFILISPLEDE
jgi:hypothetical protein